MKAPTTSVLCALCLCLSLSVSQSSARARRQSGDSLKWGAVGDGLQMSIASVGPRLSETPQLQVMFRNVGEHDITLNLGVMLANGKVQLPNRIGFNLTDSAGRTRKFDFFDGRYAAVAGRVDDYVVPLRAGSTYALNLGLDKFYSSGTNEFASKLPAGKYQITAQFEGVGAQALNLDTPGIGLMNFWKGTLQSNTLMFEK
ncbi:MAG: hypothetical protein ACJ741_16855 [Pyrinomonadaceae bacterium]